MAFNKTGETKVFKKPEGVFDKRAAKEDKAEQYTVDDLVADSDAGKQPPEFKEEPKAEEG
jgi:hypothetical protein